MESVREFLEFLQDRQVYKGQFLGLLHALIGRTIARTNGQLVCSGLTWRQLAELFKLLRWDREDVRELGLDPALLPSRDRNRFWYLAITQARVDSEEAARSAEKFAKKIQPLGYTVSLPH